MKFLIALGTGVAIHAALSLLELLIPANGTGLDPFLRLLPALVASLMASATPRASLFGAALVGAMAGGLTGLLGVSLAAPIGLPGGHALPAIASVSGSGLLLGTLAGAAVFYRRQRLAAAGP